MREAFTATDTRLPPAERSRLGASGSAFGSHQVTGLYDLLFAEAWPVTLNPGRFRSDDARMKVLARTAGILGDPWFEMGPTGVDARAGSGAVRRIKGKM